MFGEFDNYEADGRRKRTPVVPKQHITLPRSLRLSLSSSPHSSSNRQSALFGTAATAHQIPISTRCPKCPPMLEMSRLTSTLPLTTGARINGLTTPPIITGLISHYSTALHYYSFASLPHKLLKPLGGNPCQSPLTSSSFNNNDNYILFLASIFSAGNSRQLIINSALGSSVFCNKIKM